jgi:hypothetical protein
MKLKMLRRVNHRSESDLIRIVADFLRADGYRVRSEVPNMGQSADLVATKNRWLTFVEAKVHDWRRALLQCRAHEPVADFICVAIYMGSVPHRLLEDATRLGYGLIHCSPRESKCSWVRRARLNRCVWPPQRRRVVAAMRDIRYAN